jgi:hypothetical protein
MISSRLSPRRAASLLTKGCNTAPTSGSTNAKASLATISRSGKVAGISSPSMTADTRAKVRASRANQPVVSELGACGSMPPTGILPCVGRMP